MFDTSVSLLIQNTTRMNIVDMFQPKLQGHPIFFVIASILIKSAATSALS